MNVQTLLICELVKVYINNFLRFNNSLNNSMIHTLTFYFGPSVSPYYTQLFFYFCAPLINRVRLARFIENSWKFLDIEKKNSWTFAKIFELSIYPGGRTLTLELMKDMRILITTRWSKKFHLRSKTIMKRILDSRYGTLLIVSLEEFFILFI